MRVAAENAFIAAPAFPRRRRCFPLGGAVVFRRVLQAARPAPKRQTQ